jgi:hypothetical protein
MMKTKELRLILPEDDHNALVKYQGVRQYEDGAKKTLNEILLELVREAGSSLKVNPTATGILKRAVAKTKAES